MSAEHYLISYNLNGIRSAIAKNFNQWLQAESPAIVCIQELKAQEGQFDAAFYEQLGYHVILNTAQKKGYSGTAIFAKQKPDNIVIGIGEECFDNEGRLIRADFGDVTLLNSYFPSGTMGPERQAFKMDYFAAFKKYVEKLRKTRSKIIATGDFNICHKPIDIDKPEKHTHVSGYLPDERAWMDGFAESGFVDTFREFCKEPQRYSWWSHFAGSRARNIGWRIDYFWVTENLRPALINADILDKVVHSDHCPVTLRIKF